MVILCTNSSQERNKKKKKIIICKIPKNYHMKIKSKWLKKQTDKQKQISNSIKFIKLNAMQNKPNQTKPKNGTTNMIIMIMHSFAPHLPCGQSHGSEYSEKFHGFSS
jgi:hypothetical protein